MAETPRESVQHLLDRIKKIRKADRLTPEQIQNNRKYSDEAIRYLDVSSVSRKTLGPQWEKLSPDERDRFVELLGELFKVVAFPNSAKFFGELKILYGPAKVSGSEATVPVTVVHDKEGEVSIDFVLRDSGNHWLVIDVILDGVSMRNNLRTQFQAIMKKSGYSELVRRMTKKLEASRGRG